MYRSLPLFLMRWLRLLTLLCHIVVGILKIGLFFRILSYEKRCLMVQRWSQKVIRIMGIEARVFGAPPRTPFDHALLICNHTSWTDIFVLNASSVWRFIAKSEVASWPVFGYLCRGTDTLFIERNKRKDTTRMNQVVVAALKEGYGIGIFPEGTTSDGKQLLPFRSSLLQPAIEVKAPLQPAYIRYVDEKGQPSEVAAYIDDMSIGQSIWRLVSNRCTIAELHFLPKRECQFADRHALTLAMEEEIRAVHLQLLSTAHSQIS